MRDQQQSVKAWNNWISGDTPNGILGKTNSSEVRITSSASKPSHNQLSSADAAVLTGHTLHPVEWRSVTEASSRQGNFCSLTPELNGGCIDVGNLILIYEYNLYRIIAKCEIVC